ncbi:MAG: EAL domain-containing protein, partial [Oscillospiraceae bacterium]
WYYIAAASEHSESGRPELDGTMFDVTDYLDCSDDDAVMVRYRKKRSEAFDSINQSLTLADILGVDYLIRMQRPFTQLKGLYSAILDISGKPVAVPEDQDLHDNLNKKSYQRKKTIRVRHQDIAYWIIASESEKMVNDNAVLLDMMVQTVADIANSYVVLGEEMENSQNANKLLGQNFEDSILINNVYSIVFQSPDTRTAISTFIPLLTDYFDLDDILFCANEEIPVRTYRWDKSGILLPVLCEVPRSSELSRRLDYGGAACVSEKELFLESSTDRSCAVCRTYDNGRATGVMVFVSRAAGRTWTNRERKQLKNLTQILSTVIDKSFTEVALRASQERLEKLAYYDLTTNIPNRSRFELDFGVELGEGNSGAVIAVEITNLKSISEINGIEYADDIFRSCAEYISALPCSARKRVYRFSYDILFLTLTGSSREEARQLAQAILTKFHSPWYMKSNEHRLEVYAGVTIYPDDADDITSCVKAATQTLRLAKERRLDDAATYSEGLEEQLNDNLQVKKLIQDSAENNFRGFYCLYQPVLEIDSNVLHCCEARLYWGNENMIVPKSRYLPVIDRLGLSMELFSFVVDRICEFCATVRSRGVSGFRVSFAIPENVLANDACIAVLRSALIAYALPPTAVSISVSESANTLTGASVVLKQLAKIGVNIIADDSGDSFFTTKPLENEAVRTLKIRASRFGDDPVSVRFMRSVISMAKERGIAVCVRDIETREQLERVKNYDVDFVEGIYNGRPVHSVEFMERLNSDGTMK